MTTAGAPTYTVPPEALTAIGGDASRIAQLARTYLAAGEQFRNAWHAVRAVHATVSDRWSSHGSLQAVRALEVALGKSKYAHNAMDSAGQSLQKYAAELTVTQTAHTRAVAEIQSLQAELNAQPTNTAVLAELQKSVHKALHAQQQAATDARALEAALHSVTTAEWYTIPTYSHRFGPLKAAVLDSLVAHHLLSKSDAEAVAARLRALSPADYKTFSQLQAGATSDAERGHLYKELIGGIPMATIVADDQKFHPGSAPSTAGSGGVVAGGTVGAGGAGGASAGGTGGKKGGKKPPSGSGGGAGAGSGSGSGTGSGSGGGSGGGQDANGGSVNAPGSVDTTP